jgi:hypothetical protein
MSFALFNTKTADHFFFDKKKLSIFTHESLLPFLKKL